MVTRPCILAWRIPWTEEPGGLESMGSQRIDPYTKMTLTGIYILDLLFTDERDRRTNRNSERFTPNADTERSLAFSKQRTSSFLD